MRGVIFTTEADGLAAQRQIDATSGLPKLHVEEGVGGYSLANPGAAAARLRSRGVRTLHFAELTTSVDGSRYALLAADDERAQELNAAEWYSIPDRDPGSP